PALGTLPLRTLVVATASPAAAAAAAAAAAFRVFLVAGNPLAFAFALGSGFAVGLGFAGRRAGCGCGVVVAGARQLLGRTVVAALAHPLDLAIGGVQLVVGLDGDVEGVALL